MKKTKSFYILIHFKVIPFQGKNHRPHKHKMNKIKRIFGFVAVLVMVASEFTAMASAVISLKVLYT
jgi:hypothetical protein